MKAFNGPIWQTFTGKTSVEIQADLIETIESSFLMMEAYSFSIVAATLNTSPEKWSTKFSHGK